MKRVLILLIILMVIFGLSSCKKTNNNQITSLEQLKNGSYVIGAPYLTYCDEQAPREFPNAVEIKAFSDMAAAYKALQQGKIDALIQDETSARVEVSKGVDGVKILNDQLDISCDIGVGISPKTKNISEQSLNNVLENLISTKVIDDMYERWVIDANYKMPEIDYPKDGDYPVVRVATCGSVEPYSFYKNGEISGFDVELSYRIAKALNIQIVFEINPDFDSLISSVQSGKSDLLISNLYITSERKEQMPISIPYLSTHGCVIVRDYSSSGYVSLSELENKKIGYEATSTQFSAQMKKHLPNSEEVLFNSTADSIMALENNRIDAVITDLPNAKFIESAKESLKVLPEYLDKDDYGFVLSKNSPYTSEFDEVLKDFKNRNILKDLEEKWFSNIENSNKEMIVQDPSKSYTKTLKACTTALIQPMCYLNDKSEVIGFEAELLIMICDKLNYKLEFLPPVGDGSSCLASVESGRADIAFNTLSITEERKQTFDFTITYYEGAAVLLVRDNSAKNKTFFEKLGNSFNKTFVVEQRWKMILKGMLLTLLISLFSGIIGILLGFSICLLRGTNNKPLNTGLLAVTKIIQGTPIVVFLMIMYYIVFGKIDISAILVSIIAFGVNFAVYAQEIMRSGFNAVDIGQMEAARALGYSKNQAFFKIAFPQAAKKFLPVLRGEFISMVKMTSIAGYISVAELTRVGDIIRSKTMEAFFPLIAVALIYFALAELLTFGLTLFEKKLDSKNKPFKL